jgi:hypothetical protein
MDEVIQWYRSLARPFLERVEPDRVPGFDVECDRLERAATVRVRPEGGAPAESLAVAVSSAERQLVEALPRPSDEELARGLRHAVTPLFAAVVGR